jgi:hypothetical protein
MYNYLGIYRNSRLNSLAVLYEWEMTVLRIALEMGSQGIHSFANNLVEMRSIMMKSCFPFFVLVESV